MHCSWLAGLEALAAYHGMGERREGSGRWGYQAIGGGGGGGGQGAEAGEGDAGQLTQHVGRRLRGELGARMRRGGGLVRWVGGDGVVFSVYVRGTPLALSSARLSAIVCVTALCSVCRVGPRGACVTVYCVRQAGCVVVLVSTAVCCWRGKLLATCVLGGWRHGSTLSASVYPTISGDQAVCRWHRPPLRLGWIECAGGMAAPGASQWLVSWLAVCSWHGSHRTGAGGRADAHPGFPTSNVSKWRPAVPKRRKVVSEDGMGHSPVCIH
jgi:hypothetical protein